MQSCKKCYESFKKQENFAMSQEHQGRLSLSLCLPASSRRHYTDHARKCSLQLGQECSSECFCLVCGTGGSWLKKHRFE